MKNLRKFVLYLVTFFGLLSLDVIAVLKGAITPIDGSIFASMFAVACAALSAEHFAKKPEDKNGGQ